MRQSEFENAGNNTPACDQRDQIPIQIIRRLYGKLNESRISRLSGGIVSINIPPVPPIYPKPRSVGNHYRGEGPRRFLVVKRYGG